MRSIVLDGLAVATVLLTVAIAPVHGAEPTPVTHAPATLGDMPGGTRESVTRLLENARRRHGEAAVVVQTQLLLNALRNGSQLATGVRIDGVDDQAGTPFLRFHLETGIVFDDLTRDAETRVHVLWVAVMEPTIESIRKLELDAAGLAVVMQAHHRPYRTARELRTTIDDPGVSEDVAFYVRREDIAGLGTDGTVRDLFARTRITVDDTERQVAVPARDTPTSPGPQ